MSPERETALTSADPPDTRGKVCGIVLRNISEAVQIPRGAPRHVGVTGRQTDPCSEARWQKRCVDKRHLVTITSYTLSILILANFTSSSPSIIRKDGRGVEGTNKGQ